MRTTLLPLALATAVCGAALSAQDTRPLAIRNARILTLAGETIENGTVLIKGGKIKEVGADVDVPPGAETIDARGGTVMPGLVHACSEAGTGAHAGIANMPRGFRIRRRSTPPTNAAGTKLSDSLYARQEVFSDLLRAGVTTLAIVPSGTGVPGQAVRIDPSAEYEDGFVLDDDVFITFGFESKSKVKGVIKSALGSGKKALEEREKAAKEAAEAEKKAKEDAAKKKDEKAEGEKAKKDGESEPKEDPKKEPEDGPKPKEEDEKKPKKDAEAEKGEADKKAAADKKKKKPEKKKDPNAEALADLLDGKRRAFVEIESAKDLLHFEKTLGDHEFRMTLVCRAHPRYEGTLDAVSDRIQAMEVAVLLPPKLKTGAYDNVLVDPSARLRADGVEVGYVLGDSPREIHDLFFDLIELVRFGADPEDVLKGVTAVPAKLLGVSRQVGTIEAGKQADLLLFSGDPLDPTSRLLEVIYRGERVREESATR